VLARPGSGPSEGKRMWVAWWRPRGNARWERTCEADTPEQASALQNRLLGHKARLPSWHFALTMGRVPSIDPPGDATGTSKTAAPGHAGQVG
jgi:hypothetical protein